MTLYDISIPISSNLPTWPDDPPVRIERYRKIEDGARSNVSRIDMGAHSGTHVDAPYHFLGGNTLTVDAIPLDILIGHTQVIQIPDEINLITRDVLMNINITEKSQRVLFKTRNSNYWAEYGNNFRQDYVSIRADGAQYLVEQKIKLVGVDYLSVEPYEIESPTHKILLEGNIIIIEGLDLSKIIPGRYKLFCLPVRIAGAEGSPARVILDDEID